MVCKNTFLLLEGDSGEASPVLSDIVSVWSGCEHRLLGEFAAGMALEIEMR